MKTGNHVQKILTIVAILTFSCAFHLSSVSAATGRPKTSFVLNTRCITCNILSINNILAPTTPAEATFEEENLPELPNLAPDTPSEATFEETEFSAPDILLLAPVVPLEATFEESGTITHIR